MVIFDGGQWHEFNQRWWGDHLFAVLAPRLGVEPLSEYFSDPNGWGLAEVEWEAHREAVLRSLDPSTLVSVVDVHFQIHLIAGDCSERLSDLARLAAEGQPEA